MYYKSFSNLPMSMRFLLCCKLINNYYENGSAVIIKKKKDLSKLWKSHIVCSVIGRDKLEKKPK